MRCGNKLIMHGKSMAAVSAYCGRPTLVQRGFKVSDTTIRVGGRQVSRVRGRTRAQKPLAKRGHDRP